MFQDINSYLTILRNIRLKKITFSTVRISLEKMVCSVNVES